MAASKDFDLDCPKAAERVALLDASAVEQWVAYLDLNLAAN